MHAPLTEINPTQIADRKTGPAWELALLFPQQGQWTEEEYFRELGRFRGVEFSDGCVEVLPMPTIFHQFIARFLIDALRAFAEPHLGQVLFLGAKLRWRPLKVREPDVVFLFNEHMDWLTAKYMEGADLAMEVVSEDDPNRDLVKKRDEYAKAGIREYWVVDPRLDQITIHALPKGKSRYAQSGKYRAGQRARSALLPGFEVDVTATFAAGRRDTLRPSED